MFINLLRWNLYKLFWKKLFVRKYIIYNLGFTLSQSECGISWNMVQGTILDDLDSFCNDNEILFKLCFCNKQHISFEVFLCSCWVVLLKGNDALLNDQTLNLLAFGLRPLAFHEWHDLNSMDLVILFLPSLLQTTKALYNASSRKWKKIFMYHL